MNESEFYIFIVIFLQERWGCVMGMLLNINKI